MRDRQVVVRIDQETYDRLASYATETERVMSQVIRLAIKEFLLSHTPLTWPDGWPVPDRLMTESDHEALDAALRHHHRKNSS